MKFIENKMDVVKHISFICMSIYMSAIAIFNMLPAQLQQSFDQQELRWGSMVLIGIGIFGKFVEQDLGVKKNVDPNNGDSDHV